MFPVWTEGVRLLIIINLAMALLNLAIGGRFSMVPGDAVGTSTHGWLALSGKGLLDGFGLGVVRLVTYQFVHSFFTPWHLLFNMLFLYIFGSLIEPQMGKRAFIKLYLLAGLVAGIMFLLLSVVVGKNIPVVGASGCVYGVMVYAAFVMPRLTVWLFGLVPIQLWVIVGLLVFLGVWYQVLELHGYQVGQVAHSAHLGGALWGLLAFKLDRADVDTSRWNPLAKLSRWGRRRRFDAARKRQAVLDQILEKVHKEGLGALTAAEKRFLDQTSKDMNR